MTLIIDSRSDDQQLKCRAINTTRLVFNRDTYSKKLMLNALSSSLFRNSTEYRDLVQSTKTLALNRRLYIYRHCDADGRVIHIYDPQFGVEPDRQECEGCTTEHMLICSGGHHLWMDYRLGGSIPENNVVLILAGRTKNGDMGYVAMNELFEYFVHNSEQAEAAPSPRLAILRYAPDSFPRFPRSDLSEPAATTSKEGLDATGPFSWKFRRYLFRVQELLGGEDEVEDRYSNDDSDDVQTDYGEDDNDDVYDSELDDSGELSEAESEGAPHSSGVFDVASFVNSLEEIPAS